WPLAGSGSPTPVGQLRSCCSSASHLSRLERASSRCSESGYSKRTRERHRLPISNGEMHAAPRSFPSAALSTASLAVVPFQLGNADRRLAHRPVAAARFLGRRAHPFGLSPGDRCYELCRFSG